jgi:hypothetical protein
VDYLTFVPIGVKRRKERGFNQAEEIALHLGRIFNKPVKEFLIKKETGVHQAGLTQKDRLKNLIGSFELNASVEDEIKGKFAENERKYASIREEQAKIEAKIEVEIEAISKLPLKDQFFEIKFRPSRDNETFEKQRLEYNEVAKIVSKGAKSNTIPKDVIEVFKATTKKFKAVKNSKAGVRVESCEEIEQALMDKGNHDNYNAMKFSEVKNLVEQKESISIPLDNPNANLNVSKPVDPVSTKEIEPIVKNN